MAASKMMADSGGTKKVRGKTMATPFTDPKPGMAPMNRPAVTPATTIIILNRDRDVEKPSNNKPSVSIHWFLKKTNYRVERKTVRLFPWAAKFSALPQKRKKQTQALLV